MTDEPDLRLDLEAEPPAAPSPDRELSAVEIARQAGKAQFTAAELSIIIGRKPSAAELEALEEEQLKAELRVRAKIIDLAIAGSSPAQTAALGMIEARRRSTRAQRAR